MLTAVERLRQKPGMPPGTRKTGKYFSVNPDIWV